jgi:LPXTG-motif cell wall-anchored protein
MQQLFQPTLTAFPAAPADHAAGAAPAQLRPAGSGLILYQRPPEPPDRTNDLLLLAGAVLIVLAIYLALRRRSVQAADKPRRGDPVG